MTENWFRGELELMIFNLPTKIKKRAAGVLILCGITVYL